MCTVPAMMATSAMVSAYGNYESGVAGQKYYDSEADHKILEAGLVRKQGEQEAAFAKSEGASQVEISNNRQAETEGAQKAQLGANVGGGSGTAADLISDTEKKSLLDRVAIKYNADVKAWHAKNQSELQAWGLESEAASDRAAAKQSHTAGNINAASSLLQGSGQVASYWGANKMFSPSSTGSTAVVGGKRVPVAPFNYYKGASN